MSTELNKELLQKVIDNLAPANPKHKSFERALEKLVKEYEKPKPTVRLYCETQSDYTC